LVYYQGKSQATDGWAKGTCWVSRVWAAQQRQAIGDDNTAQFWALYQDVRHERDVPPAWPTTTADSGPLMAR
jgi:hypothetical protein